MRVLFLAQAKLCIPTEGIDISGFIDDINAKLLGVIEYYTTESSSVDDVSTGEYLHALLTVCAQVRSCLTEESAAS